MKAEWLHSEMKTDFFFIKHYYIILQKQIIGSIEPL